MKKKKYIKCNAISNENIFFLSSFKKFFAHYNLELSTKSSYIIKGSSRSYTSTQSL